MCGLLGPNGAGKTTAIRVLATLLRPDGGSAEVGGLDVVSQADRVRYQIGLTGQSAAVDDVLSGRQNLIMFGRLYHLSGRQARLKADELLERFGLTEAAGKSAKHYSGGMRRRLDLAASFIMTPKVLFLDEPTVGLDPRGRGEVWASLRELVKAGTTILLTTQYLDEADQMASQIAVLDRGKVIAEGTPEALKSTIGGDRVDVVLHDAAQLPAASELIGRICAGEPEVDEDNRRISAPVRERVLALVAVAKALEDAGLMVEDIGLRRPTLDEVFLQITGKVAA